MFSMLGGAGPAMPAMGGMPGLGPIDGSSSAATGDQKQHIGFNASGVSFGNDNHGQLVVIGLVVLGALYLMKK